jgi:hypothetical protein
MTVIGCDNGTTNEESDTWSNVTSFSQINGTWKTSYTYTYDMEGGIKMTVSTSNYRITFNAAAKTESASGTVTYTLSGGDINTYWSILKTSLESTNLPDGVTVVLNDANHSYTMTINNLSQTITDESLLLDGLQINQNGSKIRMLQSDTEVIYTKQ